MLHFAVLAVGTGLEDKYLAKKLYKQTKISRTTELKERNMSI